MTPRPESRIKSLERRATDIEAQLEELSSDQAEELRATRQQMSQGFNQAHAFVQERFAEINGRLERIEQDIHNIKATMATKEDLDKLEARFGKQNELLLQILQRLPKQPE